MPEDYIDIEELRRLMRSGGTNLAGQQTDPTYSSGFNYARSIAGGMPMEQVIAPGVSYSPEMAGGYTQKDLDMIAAGPAPVMPVAPTTGEVATIEDQMPYAPPGVQEPTRFMPFLQNLDFSNLPRYEDIRDIRSFEDIRPTLFDFDVEEILKDIDTEKLEDIDLSNFQNVDYTTDFADFSRDTSSPGLSLFDTPSVAPAMPTAPAFQQPTPIGDIRDTYTPEQVAELERKEIERQAREEANIINKYGSRENLQNQIDAALFTNPVIPQVPVQAPMNFTGLPQMPVIPNIPVMPELPVMPQPIVQQPIQPMNFTRLSNLPVSNFVQPSVDEIVSPISRSRTLPQTPRGLFSF